MRSSDINRRRKERYAMAVLGGAVITRESDIHWYLCLPSSVTYGYVSGPFRTRWHAVERALHYLGVPADMSANDYVFVGTQAGVRWHHPPRGKHA
jgi:hypothetical protein